MHLTRRSSTLPPRDRAGYGVVMSEVFGGVASIDYPIIDADAHVNEPPDTWQARVPARLRNRAPKVVRTEKGDVWSFDDGARLRPLGLTATAGLSYPQFKAEGFDVMIAETLSHWSHHRGQMTVYLRLMGAKVPALFGPSADENSFK